MRHTVLSVVSLRHALLALIVSTVALTLSDPCYGQDALAAEKIKGLKGLRILGIVVRPNTPKEIMTIRELGDIVELRLSRDIRELTLSDPVSASAWLEVSVITTEVGGFLALSVYRWVRVRDSGEDIFAKVWSDSQGIFGRVTRQSLQESLDSLLTRFAADYFRAMR